MNYIQGIKDECFNIFIFYKYLIIGFIEGFIILKSALLTFYFNNEEGYNLNNLYSFGNVVFSGIIITLIQNLFSER